MNRIIKSNIRKYFIHTCLYNAVLILVSGGIVQAFMLESGIPDDRVSSFVGLMQGVQAVSMITMSGVIERSDVLKVNGLYNLGLYPLLFAMLFFCFFGMVSPDTGYLIMVGAGVLTFFSVAMVSVLEYKVPYDIIDMNDYGRICAINGAMVGIGNMAITAVLSYFLKRRGYFNVMKVFLLVGCVFTLLSVWFALSYKKVDINFTGEKPESKKINLLKYRPFYLLAIPNFIRGIAYGTTTVLTTVGYHYGIIDSVSASYMVLISNIFVILGCFLYGRLTKLKKDGFLTLISSLLLAVSLPLTLLGKNTYVFLTVYGISLFIRTVMDYAIPVSIISFVDYEVMGQYSSWRMALFSAGTAVAGFICIPMLNRLGGEVTLIINGLLFFAVGVAYFIVCRLNEKGKLRKGNPDAQEN